MTSASVDVFDKHKKLCRARLLLDTCATANFITDAFVRKLGIDKEKYNINIGAMNNLNTTTNYRVVITFKSIHDKFKKTLSFLSVPQITDFIPQEIIDHQVIKIPPNVKLADPEFYRPAPIDMLIGAGPSLSLFCRNQIDLSSENSDLFLHETKLGWIIGGGINNFDFKKKYECFVSEIEFDLERFWKIEECNNDKILSIEEQKCEDYFNKTIKRDVSGRYIVSLPFKEDPSKLGNSKNVALKRLNFWIKRFERNENFKKNTLRLWMST